MGRLKINLGQSQKLGAALLTEARFATGNEDDLLGAGFSSVRVMGVGSAQFGSFAPHLNLGYLFRSSDDVNDAVADLKAGTVIRSVITFDDGATPAAAAESEASATSS